MPTRISSSFPLSGPSVHQGRGLFLPRSNFFLNAIKLLLGPISSLSRPFRMAAWSSGIPATPASGPEEGEFLLHIPNLDQGCLRGAGWSVVVLPPCRRGEVGWTLRVSGVHVQELWIPQRWSHAGWLHTEDLCSCQRPSGGFDSSGSKVPILISLSGVPMTEAGSTVYAFDQRTLFS